MGGVANIPFTLPEVEEYLNGKTATEEVFAQAGKIAQKGANPLPGTAYKVELVANTLIATLEKAFTPKAE
jgi:xanthine dehydrogenase YagS FAD-binding subunit